MNYVQLHNKEILTRNLNWEVFGGSATIMNVPQNGIH